MTRASAAWRPQAPARPISPAPSPARRGALLTGRFAAWQAAGHLGHIWPDARSFAAVQAAAALPAASRRDRAAGSRDSPDRHAENYRRQVINAFLAEMDGMARREGVIVVAACNDVAALDPAIIRPGRFDRIVEMPHPGPKGLRRILAVHAADAFDAGQLDGLVRDAVGCTPAEIEAAIREARSRARAFARNLAPEDLRAVLAEWNGGSWRPSRSPGTSAPRAVSMASVGCILRPMPGPREGSILLDRCRSTHPAHWRTIALTSQAAPPKPCPRQSGAGAGGGPGSDLPGHAPIHIELTSGSARQPLGPLIPTGPPRRSFRAIAVDRRLQVPRSGLSIPPPARHVLTMAERLADARMPKDRSSRRAGGVGSRFAILRRVRGA